MTSELREKAIREVAAYQKTSFDLVDGSSVNFAAEMLRAREDKQEAIYGILSLSCVECAKGVPVIPNSAGYYSHREEGNHCNNHRIYKFLAARAITDPKEPDQ